MKIVSIAAYGDNSPVRSHDKHDKSMTLKGVEEGERLVSGVLSFVRADHDSTRNRR